MNQQQIQSLLEMGLPGAEIHVHGEDGVHFEAIVISPEFAGLSLLNRHRRVYAALGERMGGEIHALALKAFTPAEWAQQNRQTNGE
jgi:acid stress-induced BolA-like protein IbaG/YrbA